MPAKVEIIGSTLMSRFSERVPSSRRARFGFSLISMVAVCDRLLVLSKSGGDKVVLAAPGS